MVDYVKEQGLEAIQKLYGSSLSESEARDAQDNLTGFISTLMEINKETEVVRYGDEG